MVIFAADCKLFFFVCFSANFLTLSFFNSCSAIDFKLFKVFSNSSVNSNLSIAFFNESNLLPGFKLLLKILIVVFLFVFCSFIAAIFCAFSFGSIFSVDSIVRNLFPKISISVVNPAIFSFIFFIISISSCGCNNIFVNSFNLAFFVSKLSIILFASDKPFKLS